MNDFERKSEIFSRWMRLAIIGVVALIGWIGSIVALTSTEEISSDAITTVILTSVMAGLVTFFFGAGMIKKPSNFFFRLAVVTFFGHITSIIVCFKLFMSIRGLMAWGSNFSTEFEDFINLSKDGKQKVIARIFCNAQFYAICQPYPLPRNYKTNEVKIYRIVKTKKDETYYGVSNREFNMVAKKYYKLKKKGKIKVNDLQHSFEDMTLAELKNYIANNKYVINNIGSFDADTADNRNILRALIFGFENKVQFCNPKDTHKWTSDELKKISTYYAWQIDWTADVDITYVIKQSERLEINAFYRLCKQFENVLDEQRMKARGLVTLAELQQMIAKC